MEVPGIELVERARRKDADAFAALIGIYERVVLAVAFGVLGESNAAGDVTQDAFIRAWQRLEDLREPERFGTWLCGIARNLAIDALRRRKPTETLDAVATTAGSDRWSADPAEQVGRRENADRLAAAVATLDELSRQVVAMRYYEDLSSKQIAGLLDMTPAAVDMRLSRARKQLRSLLEETDVRALQKNA